MNLRSFIEGELASNYRALDLLLDQLSENDLDWKPDAGTNWLTVGQLLEHLAGCGGATFRMMADGAFAERPTDLDRDESGLPPADAFPVAESLAEARAKIAGDHALAAEVVAETSDDDLEHKPAPVWWDPREVSLGQQFIFSIQHLNQHKGQLFYYLKLMGRPVDTSHLWGM